MQSRIWKVNNVFQFDPVFIVTLSITHDSLSDKQNNIFIL